MQVLLAEASRWAGEHDAALHHGRVAMSELPHGSDDWYVAVAESVDAAMTLGLLAEAELLARRIRELEPDDGSPLMMTSSRVVAMSRIAVRFVVSGGFEIADALISRVERDATDGDGARAGGTCVRALGAGRACHVARRHRGGGDALAGGNHVLRRRR